MVRRAVPDADYVPGLSSETNPRRGGTFRTAPQARQEEALSGLESFGSRIPERLSAEIETQKRIATGNANPSKKKAAAGVVNRLSSFQESLGTHATSMLRSVRAVSEAAQMPIEAARLQSRQEGRLIVPEAGKFYPTKYEMTRDVATSHSRDPRHILSTLLATPQLSPLTDPQTELQGGAALSFLKAHGHHGSVTLSDENVKQINSHLISKGYKQDIIKNSGVHPLSTLSPPVLAGLATHHRAVSTGEKPSTTSNWFTGATINAPDSLSDALVDFGNLGMGGWTKGASAARTFDNPTSFFSEASSGGAHKVPSYTLNSIKNSAELYRAGVHHHLGVLTHGEAWHQQHPEARDIIGKAAKLPQWSDPTYTGDVHSSALSSGLPPATRAGLGDILRPDNLFKGATGLKRGTEVRGHPFLQTAKDMGYFIGEEAHNRASRSSHFVTGVNGLQIPSPVEVTQALGWAGKQAQDKGQTLRGIRQATDVSQIVNPNTINQLSPLRTYKA